MDVEIDFRKLRYVIYARKSTDDPQRQLRSIPDQISECIDLADRLQLNVVNRKKPFTETKSAKIPGKRPIFTQLLKDIRNGKYDAILAWNPDRLARNMLEAGMLIDLADSDTIKDFKFVTHVYSPDANGKMLLGMAFVLSKQYSDKLSQDVSRGVTKRLLEEGKTPTPKHGYVNEVGVYKPDGKNFELICEAWEMRLKKISIEKIAHYLNNNGYSREVKSTGKLITMDMRMLSKIFHDPFYYGVLVQAKQQVDLRELYDFTPAVTEDDFFKIQGMQYHKIRSSSPRKDVFYPLRGIVFCENCKKPCVVGPSSGKTKKYLYYRCDNPSCSRIKRSTRAKVVFDFVYRILSEGLNFSESEYKQYLASFAVISDRRRQRARLEMNNKLGLIKRFASEQNRRTLKIIDYKTGDPIHVANAKRINDLQGKIEDLKVEVEELKKLIHEPEKDKLSIEQFLNLSKNAAEYVKSADAYKKDLICREIFLNFFVNDKKVLNYQLKEPFSMLIKQRKLQISRGKRN